MDKLNDPRFDSQFFNEQVHLNKDENKLIIFEFIAGAGILAAFIILGWAVLVIIGAI